MKNLLKKISMISCCLILSITMVGAITFNSYAAPLNAMWSGWHVVSKSSDGYSYGKWKNGVSARGAKGGKLSFKQKIDVSNTLTGNVKARKSNIEASIGFKFNKSESQTTSYSINTPNSKKRYTIKYRNVYKRTKLKQERVFTCGNKIIKTENATAYANKFAYFGYDWSSKNI